MEKAVPFRSLNRKSCILLVLLTAACARIAPALPPEINTDVSALSAAFAGVPAEIRAMSCGGINTAIESLAENDDQLERQIQANRGQNQAAGFIAGVLFLPAILAVENDGGAKDRLDQNQRRRDDLIVAFRGNDCPSTG